MWSHASGDLPSLRPRSLSLFLARCRTEKLSGPRDKPKAHYSSLLDSLAVVPRTVGSRAISALSPYPLSVRARARIRAYSLACSSGSTFNPKIMVGAALEFK